MSSDFLEERRNTLEEEFFHKENQKKLAALKDNLSRDNIKNALREASHMDDDAVLDKLVDMNIGAETLAALSMVPLIQVAWADGKMQANEREAILQGAASKGIEKDMPSHELLEGWLDRKPSKRLYEAWESYIGALRKELTNRQARVLRDQIVGFARVVAESAGGFLGLRKVSDEEEAVLAQITAAWGDCGSDDDDVVDAVEGAEEE